MRESVARVCGRRGLYDAILLSLAGLALVTATGCPEQDQRVGREPSPLPHPITPAPKPTPPPLHGQRPPSSLRGARIVMDAGHGGKDPGARGVSALPEKSIVLAISNEVHRQLAARGAQVTSTRGSDRFLELDDRAAIAERYRCALFVSIHADAAKRTSAYGTTLYIGRNASQQSFIAARRIQSALTSAGIACNGIQRAGFRVLVGHSRPAVLIETGFLTNRADAQRLNNSTYRRHIATAIATGIANYILGG